MRKGIMLLFLFTFWGCDDKPLPLSTTTPAMSGQPTPTLGVSVKDLPAALPEFKREYRVKISAQVSMIITAKTWTLGTMLNGELVQPNGKWVLFDPEAPADKILDREILPAIEQYCKQIIADDKRFRDSKPTDFVDERGDHWRKVQVMQP